MRSWMGQWPQLRIFSVEHKSDPDRWVILLPKLTQELNELLSIVHIPIVTPESLAKWTDWPNFTKDLKRWRMYWLKMPKPHQNHQRIRSCPAGRDIR